ncbi:MAG: Uma2 family endonuclease [Actinomycetota bacterium]|nr:Uma2 family endonuclease [Actinomycetota bacterium]
MATPLPAPHRFTVDEYHRMAETGLLAPDARVELIEGEVIDVPPIGPPHASVVDRLTRLLVLGLAESAIVRVQGPVRLSDISEPQPDLTVLAPRADFYALATPRPEDVLLAVEVSASSLRFDTQVKLPLYARSGVPAVWLVDVGAGTVLVATAADDGRYRDQRTAGPGETLQVPGSTLKLAVDAVLG